MNQAIQTIEETLPQPHSRGLRSSRKPRYLQVAETLREEIRDGEHPVGRHLPTETAICKRFSISRFTARAALRLLEDQGLISRRRGSGTTVRSAEAQISYDQHIRTIDDLLQYTNATGFQFLYTDRVDADSKCERERILGIIEKEELVLIAEKIPLRANHRQLDRLVVDNHRQGIGRPVDAHDRSAL